MKHYNFTEQEWNHCIKVLKVLKDDPYNNPDNQLLSGLITKVYKTSKKIKNKEVAYDLKAQDISLLKDSVIAKNALGYKNLVKL